VTKLYLREGKRITRYHEAWAETKVLIDHSGVVGTKGVVRRVPREPGRSEQAEVRGLLAPARQLGYKPLRYEQHRVLLIEYRVRRMGTAKDLERRHALEDRMNELLGWRGLGHCDGGSIGSGTMDCCCLVVDFEVAKKVIERNLRSTAFGDYTRIYEESAG
jgi:hypothetical protein